MPPGWLFLVRQYAGDWRNFAADVARIDAGVRAGKAVTQPFVYQAISQSPADLRACSEIYVADRYPAREKMARPGLRESGKIRIGYVSGEFRDQATAHLMAGLYESHDREKFRITGYDNGWNDKSAVRRRLEAAMDKVVDISRLSGRRGRCGHGAGGRDRHIGQPQRLFRRGPHGCVLRTGRRPLAGQLSGVSGDIGRRMSIDYLIADRIVIPEAERKFYTEQIVYLPGTYQVNDSRRGVLAKYSIARQRAACRRRVLCSATSTPVTT